MAEKRTALRRDDDGFQGVAISSVDILQQKFKVKFRGYDTQDVDSYLEIVAREVEQLSAANSRLHDDLLQMQHDVDRYRKKEESINSALVTVQKLADDVKGRAAAESEEILAAAQQQVDEILAASRREAEQTLAASRCEAEQTLTEARRDAARVRSEADRLQETVRRESLERKGQVQQELETMQAEARQEVARVREEARLEQTRLQESINSLRQTRMQFQVSLKALIESHLKMLEHE